MESINIREVVKKAAKKEAASFAVLYEHLVDRVFSYCMSRVANKDAAMDVTQDVFIELHKSLQKFSYQSDAAFYAFVFTIVRRRLALYYTEGKKQSVETLDEHIHTTDAISAETTLSVETALEMLDGRSREIVVLHHWSRFTFAEIGELINMKESAVRVRHHRARAMLASILQI